MNSIKIVGARENNLKNLSLEIPKGKLTIVTGPSGSGKSSLVFNTIAAEGAYRLLRLSLLESGRFFANVAHKHFQKPQVDSISNLPVVIAFEATQSPSRFASVGSFLGIDLAIGRIITQEGTIRCHRCGSRVVHHRQASIEKQVFDLTRASSQKLKFLTALVSHKPTHLSYSQIGFNEFVVFDQTTDQEPKDSSTPVEIVIDKLDHTATCERVKASIETALSLKPKFLRIRESAGEQGELSSAILQVSHAGVCEGCGAEAFELNEYDFSLRINNSDTPRPWLDQALQSEIPCLDKTSDLKLNFGELRSREIESLCFLFKHSAVARESLPALLDKICLVGLGHLTLTRPLSTLSSGELQRLRLVKQLLFPTNGIVFALDEPLAGLHFSDSAQVIALLRSIRENGNTIIVSEQSEELINASDNVIELGPNSGRSGGRIIRQGSAKKAAALNYIRPDSITALPDAKQMIEIKGVNLRNLKGVDATFPIAGFTCVSGVSGSGKSTLIVNALLPCIEAFLSKEASPKVPEFVSSIKGAERLKRVNFISGWNTYRSGSIASLLGITEVLEEYFSSLPLAKALGLNPSDFSLSTKRNKRHLCKLCNGRGELICEEHGGSTLTQSCYSCCGERFSTEVRRVVTKGFNLSSLLKLEFSEAQPLFYQIAPRAFDLLGKFSLSYLYLGQSLESLSRGEVQRLKIVKALLKREQDSLYIFDEPSLGLGAKEIPTLILMFSELLKDRNTIIAIEHTPALLIQAHKIIDLGPGAGRNGGTVIVSGTPEEVSKHPSSKTGQALRSLYFSAASSAESGATGSIGAGAKVGRLE